MNHLFSTEKIDVVFHCAAETHVVCVSAVSSTIQGSGLQSRHFLYVSDLTDTFLTLMEKGILGEVYNIGSSFEIPIVQLARELVKMKVKDVSEEALEDWMEFEDRPVTELRYPMISDKLHRLGWRPKYSGMKRIQTTGRRSVRIQRNRQHHVIRHRHMQCLITTDKNNYSFIN